MDFARRMRTLNFMTFLRKGFLLGGLSTTTWITFYPVLTTYPPRVDNSGYSISIIPKYTVTDLAIVEYSNISGMR